MASRKFVCIGKHALWSQANALKKPSDPVLTLGGVADTVDNQWLANNISGRHAGIERRKRVLKNHLHLLAVGQHAGWWKGGDVFSLDVN